MRVKGTPDTEVATTNGTGDVVTVRFDADGVSQDVADEYVAEQLRQATEHPDSGLKPHTEKRKG